MVSKPEIWIMKITPDEPHRTEEIFDGLFGGENPKNVIGWSGEEKGGFDRFKSYWNEMNPGDVIVVMEGLKKTVGVVVITSEPYVEEEGEPDWFYYRRKAKLIRRFDPPLEHDTPTNQDRIIRYSGASARKIMDEVWETIKGDYSQSIKDLNM